MGGSAPIVGTFPAPAFYEPRPLPWSASRSPRWGAALVLRRLADAASTEELAVEMAMAPEVLRAVLGDLARHSEGSGPRARVLQWLAEGGQVDDRAAGELGLSLEQLHAALEPTDALLDTLAAAVIARCTVPGRPGEYVGSSLQGPLRTMPVRFPETQYERLRAWADEHSFPMAVVVWGLVERFLDEQQRRSA